jgi:lysyl-tRNA synthetase class 2
MNTTIEILKKRSELIKKIRLFFYNAGYLEVETPILSHHASVDLHLDSFITDYEIIEQKQHPLYLQTSPEFHMKRLLAEDSGNIFQITKAFRNGEFGLKHNPEFSILEWYHININYFELMDEVEELVNIILPTQKILRMTYHESFETFLKCKSDDLNQLKSISKLIDPRLTSQLITLSEFQDFVFTHKIEPKLSELRRVFIYDYPIEQAALAKSKNDGTACRFELYIDGIEICNGFEELTDSVEQEERFRADVVERRKYKKRDYPYDKNLIQALEKGLPQVSGVAIGLDRLIMIALEKNKLKDVIAFPYDIA